MKILRLIPLITLSVVLSGFVNAQRVSAERTDFVDNVLTVFIDCSQCSEPTFVTVSDYEGTVYIWDIIEPYSATVVYEIHWEIEQIKIEGPDGTFEYSEDGDLFLTQASRKSDRGGVSQRDVHALRQGAV